MVDRRYDRWSGLTLSLVLLMWVGIAYPTALPSDGGQLDVTSYGAVANDGNDDTAAIQAAIDALAPTQIVYFPNGTYNINNTIKVYNSSTNAHDNNIILMGESRNGAIIKLLNSTSGFTSAATPKPMIQTKSGNTVFSQRLEDLTIHTGTGNCGAIGVDWISSNGGGLERVTIKSGASNKCGIIGLDLRRQWPGPMTLRNVTIDGFDRALETDTDEYGVAIDTMTLIGQLVVGLDINGHTMSIRSLTSTNTVPAVRVRDANGNVAIVGATLNGGAAGNSAIDFDAGTLYLRNITQSGYGWVLDDQGTQVSGSSLTEWWSQTAVAGFANPANGALKLSPTSMPTVSYPAVADWINVQDYGAVPGDANDDAPGIQDAIDDAAANSKTTVYLPNGDYRIESTLTIHGTVSRLIGLMARIRLAGALSTANGPFFDVTTTNSKVIFEHLILDRVSGSNPYTVMTHDINSFVQFLHGGSSGGVPTYISTGGDTKLQMIDHSLCVDLTGTAEAFAVGWNREGDSTVPYAMVDDGATFLAYLLKHEGDAVAIHARDGAQVELLGHIHKWRDGTPAVVAEFINEDAEMSVAATRWGDETLVREIIGGVTTDIQPAAPKQEALYVGW